MSLSKGRPAGSSSGIVGGWAPLDSGLLVPVAYLPVGTGAAQVAAGNHSHAVLAPLAETTLGADAAAITITGLSGVYRDLLIVANARSAVAAAIDDLYFRVGNSSIDSGTNYDRNGAYYGTGSGATSANGQTALYAGVCMGNSATAGRFSHHQMEVIGYASTSTQRTMIGRSSGAGYGWSGGGIWINAAAAVDQVQIFANGGNLKAGSKMTVYGRG